MIRDKKGMAAVMDAFIFITIIGLIAAGMFAYSHADGEKGTKAKEYYDAFFSIELRMNDVFEGTDTQCVMICDLIAAYIASDEGVVREYAEHVLSNIIPPVYGHRFVFIYDGHMMTIGNEGERLTSQYSSEIPIISGKMMYATLSLY
ncbi:MAG: hypothetical protein LBI08_00930 [Methanomassiliicoccaceae archaeon]|nr:hypothetical protein [Methanomassiliicoccaceae archaeon]